MVKKLFFCFAFTMLLCLPGCRLYTQYDIDQASERGYDSGWKAGYDNGYSDAQYWADNHLYAESDLYNSYAEGYHDAEFDHEEDWGNGYADGFHDGYLIGYDDSEEGKPCDPDASY